MEVDMLENENGGVNDDERSPQCSEKNASPNDCMGSHSQRDDEVSASLYVSGINPIISEKDLLQHFREYGNVESCSIIKDPHTQESRGYGFVNMVTVEQADAAKNGLQNKIVQGGLLIIEWARRVCPRTPTPGKYFGAPKSSPHHTYKPKYPRDGHEGARYRYSIGSSRYVDRRGQFYGRNHRNYGRDNGRRRGGRRRDESYHRSRDDGGYNDIASNGKYGPSSDAQDAYW